MAPLDPSIDRIQQCLDEVVQSVGQFRDPATSLSHQDARYELLTIRGPADLVFADFENMASLGAIRTLLEAGIFDMRAVLSFMVDEYCPAMLRTNEFLRQHHWQDRIGLRSNPYTLVHHCEGQTMFEQISQSPARLTRLSNAMVAEDSLLAEIGLYPFVERLSPLAQANQPTIVDIGGGRGHIDRASVISDNGPQMTRHGIEPMAHEFFTPQPVKEIGATMAHAYMDHTMMTFGRTERTAKDFARLFDAAGLQLVQVWESPGVPMRVVEACLK
ncbi:hypothetical protein ASPACDRAFT_54717 [Aspergillus aculeatus ATCC 16872]|uniref:O-methyltransferase domain-containing protein n=1 Tax=Aspergillus aculeatus (strain ATCC 16872 / CBS 172.66 / WB 5094) TaxID=690307 RepID=A0A1L9WJP7_ASPA1|nr:uncharacterized protein ASPACDRAFT_54717 [Aspergillus aculeatus ATCC 16872]OJJ96379.1 hypothetical protein ASPACDRAFT_54717 [Aspergillus aculeatus ATCC 16872]